MEIIAVPSPGAAESAPKPRFFELVGWSWLIVGVLGVLFGLLSLHSLTQLDTLRASFARPPFSDWPEVRSLLLGLLDWYGPLTFAQLALAAATAVAAWRFLERREGGRLALAALNILTLGAATAGF